MCRNQNNTINNQRIDGDHNTQIGENSGTVNIHQMDENLRENIKEILSEIKKYQDPTPTPSPQENQSFEEIIARLISSNKEEKQQALKDIAKGDIAKGIERLKELNQKQSQNLQTQGSQLVETKLELATILNYSDPGSALRYLAEAVAIDPENLAASNLYGLLLMRIGKTEEAEEAFTKAYDIAEKQKDKKYQGWFLGHLGLVYDRLGKREKAITRHQQALAISRELKDRQGESSDLGNLGAAYDKLDEKRKAITYYEQALEISRDIKDRRGEGNQLGNLGIAYDRLDDPEKAITHYQQALEISRDIKDRQGEGNQLGNLGKAYVQLGDIEKAADYYKQAILIFEEIKPTDAREVKRLLSELTGEKQ